MTENICAVCGLSHRDDTLRQAANAVALLKAETVKNILRHANQPSHADAIELLILGWRSHCLPVCDPLALL
jgi:hypothetical protein